jgi:Fe-S cluster assembly ATP-binding protein
MGFRKGDLTVFRRDYMLELKNVSFGVETDNGTKNIIHDVSLTFDDNKFYVITGPNGGGKSTLAKLIVGIEKPDKGQIFFNGEDITGLSITERARKGISYAMQQPVKFKGIQVIDLLRIASGKHLSRGECCEYLSEVGLCANDYVEREVNSALSGGELKRIEIATVIARGTTLSVFDEPEAGIDLWSFQNLIRVFERMQKKYKGTMIIISHQERILKIADDIIVIADGRVTKKGPRNEILPELLGTDSAVTACCQLEKGDL